MVAGMRRTAIMVTTVSTDDTFWGRLLDAMDALSTAPVPDTFLMPQRSYERHFSIMDDFWNVPIFKPTLGWSGKRLKDWESPLPHQRSGTACYHTRIEASGLPPRHPTKGFRRSHKNFARGSR